MTLRPWCRRTEPVRRAPKETPSCCAVLTASGARAGFAVSFLVLTVTAALVWVNRGAVETALRAQSS